MNYYTRVKPTDGLKPLFFARLLGVLGLLLLLLAGQAHSALYETESGRPRQLTEPENWVLEQISQGKEADLKKRFPGEQEKYSLDGGFLKALFNNGLKNVKFSNQGVKIANATIEGDLDLDNVEINYPVYLKHCTFKGPVTIKRGFFAKDLSFEGSGFFKSANFSGIKIDGNFIFDEARFEDAGYWWDARIGLEFQAVGVEFRSPKAPADFNSMAVGDSAHFRGKFYGPTSFRRVRVGKQFDAREAKFFNLKEPANFYGMKAGHTLFNKTEFYGPVNFDFVEITENFWATGAKFLNAQEAKNFTNMKVGQNVFLDGIFIRGALDFSFGNFNDLEIDGRLKDSKDGPEINAPIPSLKLKRTLVKRDLNIANLNIDELGCKQIQVKGQTTIENTQILKLADFRSASFQSLDFENVKWPEVDPNQPQDAPQKAGKEGQKHFRYEVYLGEVTFSSIIINKPECEADAKPGDCDYDEKDFKLITDFVDACPFYTQSYVQVEAFFKRLGRESWANKVFILMNNRELSEKMEWYDPRRWLEWFFWGQIAGYGRAPFRVLFLGLAFIILGACLFDPQFLQDNRRATEGSRYRSVFIRLILSLDRFLPIELGLANHWDAKNSRFPIWLYFYLQQIVGWILIPIALASIYSQLK